MDVFSLDEQSPTGTSAGTASASDPDETDELTYSIVGGNTDGAFAIDPSSGLIIVANAAAIDFETNPVFALEVQVQDLDGLTDTATYTINLNDINGGVVSQIEDLTDVVDDLLDEGEIAANDGAKLHRRLDKAIKNYNIGKENKAIKALELLIKDVEKLANRGDIDATIAQSLIDAAQTIIATINNEI